MSEIGRALAEHSLTLRRTLAAIGWAALVGFALVLGYGLVLGAGGGSVSGAALWFVWTFVGAVLLGPLLVAAALWALRRAGPGRTPRVVAGVVLGLVVGLVEELLFTGMDPVALIRTEPEAAFLLFVVPVVSGTAAGALVGPRPQEPDPADLPHTP